MAGSIIKKINQGEQSSLEKAVLDYQLCIKTGNKVLIQEAYDKVCEIYNPHNFKSTWWEKYHYLYDSQDDFTADYMRIFSSVLIGWTPRENRKKSRYDGTGEFKNYFIGSLHHNYINMVKSDQAGKRNVTKKCPICGVWVTPLSTHIRDCHVELLWDQLELANVNMENLSSCPLCKTFKIPPFTSNIELQNIIKKHLISQHSTHLFSRFNDLYPDDLTMSPKPNSIYIEENGEELDLTDTVESSQIISNLMCLNLSDVQQAIIHKILSGDLNINYNKDTFDCTSEEFNIALEGLQDAMVICGAIV